MAENAPGEVLYGKVKGFFVEFLADENSDNVPDQRRLTGTVTLTPSVGSVKWPTTTPPRTASIGAIYCPVWNGYMCPPGTPQPNAGEDPTDVEVTIAASFQPDASPSEIGWTASFQFQGLSGNQPASVNFVLESNETIDLTSVQSTTAPVGTIIVVSEESRLAAEAAQAAAEAARDATPKLIETTQTEYDASATYIAGAIYCVTGD